MKRALVCGLVLGVGALVGSAEAQVDIAKIAGNVRVDNVKRMEVIAATNGLYYAAVDVEFINSDEHSVKLHDGNVEVWFDLKEGVIEKKATSSKETITVTVGTQTVEGTVYDRVVGASESVKLGEITLGDKVVPQKLINDEKMFPKKMVSAVELKAPAAGEKQRMIKQTLYVQIGKIGDSDVLDRVIKLSNIMGDPSRMAKMQLKIKSKVSVGAGNNWIGDGTDRMIELNLEPSVQRDYLFK